MQRLLAIAVLGAAAVLPPHLGAQFRSSMRFAGPVSRGPMFSSAPRVTMAPNFHPGFRTVPSVGFRHFPNHGFVFTGVGFGHNPHFRVFVGSPCFGCRARFVRRAFFYPSIYPAYYPPVDYAQPSYASQPTMVVQSAPPADYGQSEQLLQEVEGLREEVRQLREEQSSRQPARQENSSQPGRAAPARGSAPADGPATVLVFRDGHRNEIQNYAIAGQTLWVFNERQAKKILISELDLPATEAANTERGVEFSLPR